MIYIIFFIPLSTINIYIYVSDYAYLWLGMMDHDLLTICSKLTHDQTSRWVNSKWNVWI